MSEQSANVEAHKSLEEAESAINEMESGSILTSAPAITGFAVLGVIVLLAIVMGVRAKNRRESFSVWDFSEEKGNVDDVKRQGGSRYGLDAEEERSGTRSKGRDKEGTIGQLSVSSKH